MTASNYFGTTDYIFMGLYVLVLIFLGFYLKRLASRSLDNYITGGKNIPWWAMGISGMASFLDLAGTAVIVSFLFLLGPQGLFVEFRGGAVLVLPFMMLWTGKWHPARVV
jgi:Na+/proline symporter